VDYWKLVSFAEAKEPLPFTHISKAIQELILLLFSPLGIKPARIVAWVALAKKETLVSLSSLASLLDFPGDSKEGQTETKDSTEVSEGEPQHDPEVSRDASLLYTFFLYFMLRSVNVVGRSVKTSV
jgi:hypothetical protein